MEQTLPIAGFFLDLKLCFVYTAQAKESMHDQTTFYPTGPLSSYP
jgi:hypothetical protein